MATAVLCGFLRFATHKRNLGGISFFFH